MARRKVYTQTFQEGLNTTGLEDGLRLPRWSVFQNIRVNEGPAKRRKGIQRIDTVVSPHTALDLTAASSHEIQIPNYAGPQALKKRWSLEYLYNPDGVSGTQYIHAWAANADPVKVYLNGDTLTAVVKDTGDTEVTLTAASQTATKTVATLIRDGTALSLWVNGALADSDTMADLDCKVPSGDMYFGSDGASGNFYDGLLDYARAFNYPLTNQRESLMRLVDPRADTVLWDYVFEIAEATTKRVDDRSSFGNHGVFVGTAATGTAQTVQVTPVNLLHPYRDSKSRNRLAVIAGSEVHLAEVGI